MITTERKALLISYVWPPMEGVGLLRAVKFAKYLPENGWEPVVLTVKAPSQDPEGGMASPAGVKVFRTDYRDVLGSIRGTLPVKGPGGGRPGRKNGQRKKRPSMIRELISMPDDQAGWYEFAVSEGGKVIESERIDLIISTSPPETAHLIGRSLKKRFGIPWVADMRDLWADDHFRPRPLMKRLVLRRMEKKVLNDADAVITVSEPWARTLGASLGTGKGRVNVVENGFDEEDFGGVVYGRNRKLVISYTGKLHDEKQPVAKLFKALKGLIGEGLIDRGAIEVRFCVMGYDKPDITAMAKDHGLAGVVIELDRVGYEKSLELQRTSDALLFVQWQGKGSDGWYSAKLYDYIGSKRPILALASKDGIVAELIRKTSSGVIADDEASLREALLKFYGEHRGTGRVNYNGNEAEIAMHTRRKRTRRLAAILDSVVEKHREAVPSERRTA